MLIQIQPSQPTRMPALVNALFVLLAKENGPALARFADASGAQTHGTEMRLLCLDRLMSSDN